MTISLNGKALTNEIEHKYEDLTKIRGIGSIKQQWLRELLHIYTFRDLSSLSVAEIESRLRAEGHIASKSEIEGWIVQAQTLAAAEPFSRQFIESSDTQAEESPHLPTQESESSQPVIESADTETEGTLLPLTEQSEWKPFASFKVEFQSSKREGQAEEQRIIVHDLKANTFQTWSEMDSNQIQQWMLDRVTEESQQTSEVDNAISAPPVTIEITQLQILQPLQTERAMVIEKGDRLFPNAIISQKPFALNVSFSLAGLIAANLTQREVVYYAQLYARNRVTGVISHLGDTELRKLIKEQLSYKTMLAEITLEPGLYRLQIFVKLQDLPAIIGSFKVPLLQVV